MTTTLSESATQSDNYLNFANFLKESLVSEAVSLAAGVVVSGIYYAVTDSSTPKRATKLSLAFFAGTLAGKGASLLFRDDA